MLNSLQWLQCAEALKYLTEAYNNMFSVRESELRAPEGNILQAEAKMNTGTKVKTASFFLTGVIGLSVFIKLWKNPFHKLNRLKANTHKSMYYLIQVCKTVLSCPVRILVSIDYLYLLEGAILKLGQAGAFSDVGQDPDERRVLNALARDTIRRIISITQDANLAIRIKALLCVSLMRHKCQVNNATINEQIAQLCTVLENEYDRLPVAERRSLDIGVDAHNTFKHVRTLLLL